MDLDHRKMTLIEKVDALTISHEGVEHIIHENLDMRKLYKTMA